jgi:predicted PurR-regulated permease PerM
MILKKYGFDIIVISFICFGFLFLMSYGLFPALIAGLITYLMMRYFEFFISNYLKLSKYSKFIATVTISVFIITILTLSSMYLFHWISKTLDNPDILINETAIIIDNTFKELSSDIAASLPNTDNLKSDGLAFIQSNLILIRDFSKGATHTLITMIIAMIIGIMIAADNYIPSDKKLILTLRNKLNNLVESFKHVVVAQAGIALFNTIMTSIFLLFIMPLFDVHFPFTKTIIFLTFFLGLIPIIGNILVNVIVLIIGLSVSLNVGLVAFLYLIFIHKFEWFLNAKIIGGRIEAKAFELLISMLLMESIFGIIGLIAAPILYSYIKKELKYYELV